MKADVKNVKIFTHLKDNLKLKDEELPSSEQLTGFRCNFKRKRVNEIVVKDRAHFISWIETHNSDPQKPNELFVISYKLEKNNFTFILSSLAFLKNARDQNQYEKGYACIDSTYKLTT